MVTEAGYPERAEKSRKSGRTDSTRVIDILGIARYQNQGILPLMEAWKRRADMQKNWRKTLNEQIKKEYIHNESREWFFLFLSTNGSLDIAIVSDRFGDLSNTQRRERVQDLLSRCGTPFEIGMITLYTVDEAKHMDFMPFDPM